MYEQTFAREYFSTISEKKVTSMLWRLMRHEWNETTCSMALERKMKYRFERSGWMVNLSAEGWRNAPDSDSARWYWPPPWRQTKSPSLLVFFSCRNPLLYILTDGSRTRCKTGLVRINWSRRQETTESLWLRPFNSRIKVRTASSGCRIFEESKGNSKS